MLVRWSFVLVLPLALVSLLPSLAAEPGAPVKVGILGMDNYQAVEFTQFFNNPKATGDLAGLRVVAGFAGGSPDIPESVRALPMWLKYYQDNKVAVLPSMDAVLKQVDVVMIMSLDGRSHLEMVKAAVKAGKPAYIGRPLAASLADAVEMYRLAKENKVPIFSCSQHRFSPGFIGMRNHPEVGKVLGCDVYGGCPREPHHPDLFWHGIHGVETLYTIMGPGCVSVTRVATDTADQITGTWNDGRVGTYRGIRKGALKYSATVFGDKGVSTAGIYGHGIPVKGVVPDNDKYMAYEALAMEIGKFFKTRKPPVSAEETIELFAFMEAADESKRQNGAPVKLATVLAKIKAK